MSLVCGIIRIATPPGAFIVAVMFLCCDSNNVSFIMGVRTEKSMCELTKPEPVFSV